MISFMKNIAIIGGFLQVIVLGAGTVSLDAFECHAAVPEGLVTLGPMTQFEKLDGLATGVIRCQYLS